MNWTRADRRYWQSDSGYRIAVSPDGAGFVYCAFAPALDHETFKDLCRVRYARGEAVPQPRAPLGCFDAPEPARQACARHAGETFPLNPGAQHEIENRDRGEPQAGAIGAAGDRNQIGLGL